MQFRNNHFGTAGFFNNINTQNMKFYNRENELQRLHDICERSYSNAQMTVVTGRRRIGKTQLLLKATENQPTLYFFIARKAENLLCLDFQQEIAEKLGVTLLGETSSFAKLFEYLMKLSIETPFNLIIDEFQEFFNVAPAVYSEMQHYWDINKDKSRINLLLSGSVQSLMYKIFQSTKEPLFGRATDTMRISPFSTSVLKEILKDHYPEYKSEDLLGLYTFTGGVAKYVQLFMDNGATTFDKMLNFMLSEDSQFINEGKNLLIEEFGKEYAVYFSILSCIARGENTRAKIEAVVKREIGGYLTRLDIDYGLISKVLPLFSKVETKNVRYILEDNFLSFWFRFLYKYSYMIEIGAYGQLKEIVKRDYPTFSGKMLERYFRTRFIESNRYTRLGGYWDRKGENEIDLITVDELNKTADIIEIKRNKQNMQINKLIEKFNYFTHATGELTDYQINFRGLSLDEM